MQRLVHAEGGAARQCDLRDAAPALFVNRRGLDALAMQLLARRVDVVAHEIELVEFLAVVGWMDGELTRRRREDQPAAPHVDRREAEHVAEERAGRVILLRVDQRVHADDSHVAPYLARSSRVMRWRLTSGHSVASTLYMTLSRTEPSRRA